MKFTRLDRRSRTYSGIASLILIAIVWTTQPVDAQTPDALHNGMSSATLMSDLFAEIAKRVEPAVVSIDTKGPLPELTTRRQPGTQNPPDVPDDILEFLRRQMPRRSPLSVGSGFIVDKAGYIITNAHVVDSAVRITVRLDNGEEYLAKVLGTDAETDIAVLKIDVGRDLPYVALGDSDKIRVGEWVLALGSPFGLSRSVTAGIVSNRHRETPNSSPFQKFIQTDAAINRGNSGGPLVNAQGEVIGVNSQIATSTGDYNGVGFALPSNEARFVYDQILQHGRVKRGFLGVLLDTVKPEFAKVYNMGETRGAIITDVRAAVGPAAAAGLRTGDIVVGFDGKPVISAQDLIAKVGSTSPDHPVRIDILRENGDELERRSIDLRLGERPIPASDSGRNPDRTRLPVDRTKEDAKPFGLTLVELTPQMATTYKIEGQKGVVVKEINPESFIADVKTTGGADALGEGDVIVRINRTPVGSEKAFAEAVAKLKKGDPVVLHVMAFDARTRTSQLKIVQFTVQ